MERLKKRLDGWSQLVVLLTLVMFAVAVFVKGIGHDLLLEGAVFLVSAKLVLMAYKNSVAAAETREQLAGLQATLTRLADRLEPGEPANPAAPPAQNRRPPA